MLCKFLQDFIDNNCYSFLFFDYLWDELNRKNSLVNRMVLTD